VSTAQEYATAGFLIRCWLLDEIDAADPDPE
jgi:hypothetical protein